MDSPIDRTSTTPFLLRLFYRTGAFHRPDEFSSSHLPPSIDLYAWPTCTLTELSHQLAASTPSLLPSPAIGTRLAFRLIYADARAPAPAAHSRNQQQQHHPARFVVKDLGSVVIGGGGPGADEAAPLPAAEVASEQDASRTLGEAKFVAGDYVSCAILPPLADGEVAPASSARTGRGAGIGEAGPLMGGVPPPARRESGPGGGRGAGRGGRGTFGGFGGGRDASSSMPMGEWRRGERLPDAPSGGRGKGRQRW